MTSGTVKYAPPPLLNQPTEARAYHSFPSLLMNGYGNFTSGPGYNVIVFGETGAGKSSVLNMLDGDSDAKVSSQADGVTFSNKCYEKMILGSRFRVFDTVGLNEGSAGTVAARDAIAGLYQLIRQLTDGVNLLVYVMRAPRIKATAKQNYDMFFEVFCGQNVPIVLVVTGLEGEENMDQWWAENKETFDEYKMPFCGSACITATKGKVKDGVHIYEAEYESSKKKVEALISSSSAKEPWKMPTIPWFTCTVVRLRNIFATTLGLEPIVLARELYLALRDYAGLSIREAKINAYAIEKFSIQKRSGPKRFLRLK